MRYSINRRYYGFLSFVRNIGKNLSNRYSQMLLDSAKKSATDAKKLLQKEQFKQQLKQLAT